jgi:hypothetical protein
VLRCNWVPWMLDRKCGNNIHENTKYGRWAQKKKKKKKEDKVGAECAIEAHPGSGLRS